MTKNQSTKRAFCSSVAAVVICVAMLIGTTFAWFTSTASTGVNKIESGTLKVDIVDAAGESIQNKTMSFVNKNESANILWEPGATFHTPVFKIKSLGNLALKYKLILNGVTGTNKLLEVLKFSVVKPNGEAIDLNSFEGHLTKETPLSEEFYIQGTMDPAAGNEYQGLELNGLGITVVATQDTVETDSNNNRYDEAAAYKGTQSFTGGTHTLNSGAIAQKVNDVAVNVSGNGTSVTITGGYYDGGEGGNNRCIQVNTGATVTIKDGVFTVGKDASGTGNSVVLCNGGAVNIEGGFFYTDYNWRGFFYVLNQQNSTPGTITVKGGTFVNYDPSKGDDNLGGNFVASGYSVITETKANGDKWYTVVSNSNFVGLKKVLTGGGNLNITSDIVANSLTDTADASVIVKKPTTLNLNNKKIISPDNMGNNSTNFCALYVEADTTINATENGGINTGTNGGYGINVNKGASLTINGGYYYGGGTAIQVQKGTLVINGGTFAVEPYSNPVYGYKFLLNCIDANYKNGTAKIIVKGGTFVNFDPSNNAAEGEGTNFVAEGYKVVSEQHISEQHGTDTWYTVVPK